MPAPITEFFNGGVVTARHSALLAPGELQRGDDCVYRDRDPAIWRAPGRLALNSTALGSPSAIKGLAHASYEKGRNDHLLAYVGTAMHKAALTAATPPTIDALTFSEIGGIGNVAGTISSTTTFVATTGFPFLADIVGSPVFGAGVVAGTIVTAVSNQDGTTGHYNTVTLSLANSNGAITLNFPWGCVQSLVNQGTEILDVAQYGTAYFAWFGNGAPRRLSWRGRPTIAGTGYDDTLISRPMGLEPVVTPPTITEVSNAAYLWNPLLGGTGLGVYWFVITEAFSPSGDLTAAEKTPELAGETMESAYLGINTTFDPNGTVGLPIPITLTAITGKGIQIVFPAVVNNGSNGRLATHWCVYMYGPTADVRSMPSLAQLRRVRVLPITQYTAGFTHIMTETTTVPQTALADVVAADDGAPSFEFDTRMTVEGEATAGLQHAYAKSPGDADGPGTTYGATKLSDWDFDVSGVYATASITGIRVDMKGGGDSEGNTENNAGYYIHVDTGSKHTGRFINVATRNRGGIYSLGGPFDTLGVAWVVGDLASISVTIGKTGSATKQRLAVDWIKLTVFFTGGTINLNGPAYRVVTYRDQVGTTVSEPVNLPPPHASTGCFFQGSLVLNDLSDETAIRFSLAGRPEAFPKPYVMRFNTAKRKDKVKYLNSLGPFLVAGLENSIKRVGYLPKETDTDLESGLAHEDIATDHGIPGPFAAVRFDMPGEGTILAYASISGPFVTNGLAPRPLNIDLDWANTVKTSALATCVFKVYAKEKWLVLFYCPAGATHNMNTRALIFPYQADKIKPGGYLPVIGPIVVSARSAVEVMLSGNTYLFTGHESLGKVYQEDIGTTNPSGYQVRLNDDSGVGDGKSTAAVDVKIIPLIRTRKMYPAGIAHDAREERILLLFSPYGSTITATGTTVVGNTTITSSAAFGSVLPGMRVKGDNLDPGTIVLSKSDSSTIVVSRAPHTAGSGTLSFDTGTISVTVRGSGVGEAVEGFDTEYGSTLAGDLITFHNDNARQGLELQFEKVPLTFDANHDSATWADLGVNMRLHQFTVLMDDMGTEQNRSSA